MNSFEFNKIAGGVLAALLVAFGSKALVSGALTPHKLDKPVYQLASAPATDTGASDTETAAAPMIGPLLAAADIGKGKKIFAKCKSCHTANKGGANKIGPALYNVVGRNVAKSDGFVYSKALQKYAGDWTFDRLDCFLTKPKKCVKGTKMAFVGLKKIEDRANLVAFLRANSDSPVPLP